MRASTRRYSTVGKGTVQSAFGPEFQTEAKAAEHPSIYDRLEMQIEKKLFNFIF